MLTQKQGQWVTESVRLKTLVESPLYKELLGNFFHSRTPGREVQDYIWGILLGLAPRPCSGVVAFEQGPCPAKPFICMFSEISRETSLFLLLQQCLLIHAVPMSGSFLGHHTHGVLLASCG